MSVPSSSCCPFDNLVKISLEWKSADLIRIQELHAASPCQHAPLKEIMLTGIRYEQSCIISPLFIAIEQGDLEMVKLIIELWGVNIHTAFLDTFLVKPPHSVKLLTFEKVTPLFAAALYKHFDIIRYLVEQHGANISAGASIAATDDDDEDSWVELTPLHAAFLLMDQHNDERSVQLDIIQFLVDSKADPNVLSSKKTFLSRMVSLVFSFAEFEGREIQLNKWINPDAISLLIQLGMSVTQKCPQNRTTVLHNVARTLIFDHVDAFVDLLVEKEADLQARDTSGFTPIMSAADGNGRVPNITFLTCLLERKQIPIKDKIESLEVAAAVLLGYETNADLFQIAFNYLTRARNLRIQENLLLTPQPHKNGRAIEWITSPTNDQDIQQHHDEFEMQSTLIRLRIFSALSWKAVYDYLWRPYITRYYLIKLEEENVYGQILDITWTVLEIISHFDLDEERIWYAKAQAIGWISESLEELRRENNSVFNIESLESILRLASKTYQIILEDNDEELSLRYLIDLYRLISMSAGLLPTNGIIESVRNIVGQNGRDKDGRTWIHIHTGCVCPGENFFPVLDLLKESGADLHAVTKTGEGALHLLATWEATEEKNTTVAAAARFLLAEGLHLDRVNIDGMTAADYYRHLKSQQQEGHQDPNNLPDWLKEGVPKLMCRCAKVIQRLKIPYRFPGYFPAMLIPFVDIH